MREVLYEDELDARARQQRALYLKHTIDEIEKQRLEYEDERLNKVIVSVCRRVGNINIQKLQCVIDNTDQLYVTSRL